MPETTLKIISHITGSRWDLVQAGGGNTAVKTNDGQMLIKASGFHLSEIGQPRSIARISLSKIMQALESSSETSLLPDEPIRPSLEVWLHALLPSEITIHTHPLAAMPFLNQPDWKEKISSLFPEAILVDYHTPGISLARALLEHAPFEKESIIFFQNHGLMVGASHAPRALELQNEVVDKLAANLQMELSHFKDCTRILLEAQRLDPSLQGIWLSSDLEIHQILQNHPDILTFPWCSPDIQVYSGFEVCQCEPGNLAEALLSSFQKHTYPPRAVLMNRRLFTLGPSQKKARDLEEILKYQFLTTSLSQKPVTGLKSEECKKLSNWEAEKYRWDPACKL